MQNSKEPTIKLKKKESTNHLSTVNKQINRRVCVSLDFQNQLYLIATIFIWNKTETLKQNKRRKKKNEEGM